MTYGRFCLTNPGRREFLRAVPAGAAAGFTIANASLFSQAAAAQTQSAGSGASFQVFTAQEIQDDMKALDASPGNNNLVQEKTFTVVLTTETAKTGAEYEWHEGRDHVFQILDGETVYEVGGTPKGAHSKGPGRMACAGVGRHDEVYAEERRHAGGPARHAA